MSQPRVTLSSRNGTSTTGAIAEPAGDGKAPAVVLLQEWWGVNAHIEDLARRLAKEGFLVVAPDLYHGTIAKDAAEAQKLSNELETASAMADVSAAVTFLKSHPRSNGKVGVVGFCLGGAYSFAAACHIEGLSAAVPFYGVPAPEKVDYAKVTAPIQAHFARNDAWASVTKAEAIKNRLAELGHRMELHVYDAGHAFMNDTRPEAYDAESAKLAWDRTVAFFQKHLA